MPLLAKVMLFPWIAIVLSGILRILFPRTNMDWDDILICMAAACGILMLV